MNDSPLVVEGRVLDVRLDGSPTDVLIVVEVSHVWRLRPPEPLEDWRPLLLSENETWPRLRIAAASLGPGLRVGQAIVTVAHQDATGWRIEGLDLDRPRQPARPVARPMPPPHRRGPVPVQRRATG